MPIPSPLLSAVVAPDRDRPDLIELRRELAGYGLPVELASVHDWSSGVRLKAEEADGRPAFWVYGPAERDPARNARGKTVMPARQLRTLHTLAALEMPGHRVAIAHEVAPERVAVLRPRLQPGTHPCPDDVARALVGSAPAHPALSRAVRALDSVLGGATAALGTAARRTADTLLDPVVFAVFALGGPRDGEPALWVPLVAWRW